MDPQSSCDIQQSEEAQSGGGCHVSLSRVNRAMNGCNVARILCFFH